MMVDKSKIIVEKNSKGTRDRKRVFFLASGFIILETCNCHIIYWNICVTIALLQRSRQGHPRRYPKPSIARRSSDCDPVVCRDARYMHYYQHHAASGSSIAHRFQQDEHLFRAPSSHVYTDATLQYPAILLKTHMIQHVRIDGQGM